LFSAGKANLEVIVDLWSQIFNDTLVAQYTKTDLVKFMNELFTMEALVGEVDATVDFFSSFS
jgi:hypothetical protein